MINTIYGSIMDKNAANKRSTLDPNHLNINQPSQPPKDIIWNLTATFCINQLSEDDI